jgi:hypothetical protein
VRFHELDLVLGLRRKPVREKSKVSRSPEAGGDDGLVSLELRVEPDPRDRTLLRTSRSDSTNDGTDEQTLDKRLWTVFT